MIWMNPLNPNRWKPDDVKLDTVAPRVETLTLASTNSSTILISVPTRCWLKDEKVTLTFTTRKESSILKSKSITSAETSYLNFDGDDEIDWFNLKLEV
ncbi:MAG: hypothetical protein CM15mP88_0100 [Pseudomonadota bacterium]|nr:MAG: hypothetical protein CM15mP88_0100 [Pseudomonadota bacterium]